MARTKRKARRSTPAWGWILGLGAVLLIAALVWAAVRGNSNGLPAEITVQEAYQHYQTGEYFLLDVRTPQEWNEVHVPGAVLIPLDELPQRLDEVPRNRPVMVICRSGNRSAVGRDILKEAGFAQVTSIAGGIRAWMAAGYPVTSGP